MSPMPTDYHALIPDRCGSQYSRAQVLEVAAQYVVIGNPEGVAAVTGVTASTIYGWRKQEWWDAVTAAIRDEHADELDSALSGVIRSSVAVVADRLANGDHKLLKIKSEVGERVELARVPVGARDAAVIAAISIDKRQILRNLPTAITDSSGGRLRQLQDQLRQLSGRTIEARRVDDGAEGA